MIYHTITAENPLIPRNSSNGMQIIRNMKLTLLSFQERFLNFRENMGISATSNHEKSITIIIRYITLDVYKRQLLYYIGLKLTGH